MGAQVEIEFLTDGFAEVLRSDGVRGVVQSATDNVANKANANITGESDGFYTRMVQGYSDGRWIGQVIASDVEALIEESERKVLTGAIT